jgi:hypothetical protein
MWNEPMPKWRKAHKQHQCQGDGCTKVIAYGELYLDRALRQPAHSHLRYCRDCAGPVIQRANECHFFNGRSNFPDRYQQRISSAQWKTLKREVIEQRGNRCERCGQVGASLAMHHLHYCSLGSEQPEDVELLCLECHTGGDEARAAKNGQPQYEAPQEGLIVGLDGVARWGEFDPDTIYIPLKDGRNVPVLFKRKGKR